MELKRNNEKEGERSCKKECTSARAHAQRVVSGSLVAVVLLGREPALKSI
jgi:hypothetical protein